MHTIAPFARFFAFIRLARPLFLAGGFVMHALGVMVALHQGANLDGWAFLWGQLTITATQLMTHFANEYYDLDADLANATPTFLTGGSRVLPAGELSPHVALITAETMAGVALVSGAVLVVTVQPTWLTFWLLVTVLVLSWEYSAPPLRLHSRGVDALTVAVVVTGLTPLLGYYLQTGRLDALILLTVFPLCCLQMASMLTVAFPDAASDAAVGKNTLVVRLGDGAARLHNGLLAAAYALLPLLTWLGLPLRVALAMGTTAPLAVWQVWRIRRGDWYNPARWGWLAFGGITLLMSMAVLAFLAFGWLWLATV